MSPYDNHPVYYVMNVIKKENQAGTTLEVVQLPFEDAVKKRNAYAALLGKKDEVEQAAINKQKMQIYSNPRKAIHMKYGLNKKFNETLQSWKSGFDSMYAEFSKYHGKNPASLDVISDSHSPGDIIISIEQEYSKDDNKATEFLVYNYFSGDKKLHKGRMPKVIVDDRSAELQRILIGNKKKLIELEKEQTSQNQNSLEETIS